MRSWIWDHVSPWDIQILSAHLDTQTLFMYLETLSISPGAETENSPGVVLEARTGPPDRLRTALKIEHLVLCFILPFLKKR